jgi:hypothetical protein
LVDDSPNCLVKVLPYGSSAASLGGYFTVGNSLLGEGPQEIGHSLGLPRVYLARGATVFRLARLPRLGEYEYELTAKHPGGLAYVPSHSHPAYPPAATRFINGELRTEFSYRFRKAFNCLPATDFHMIGSNNASDASSPSIIAFWRRIDSIAIAVR